ncbi:MULTISPECIES: hypothetical protein [unclassified Streptomyces]|uniref:hypothetical protein n=1 Tax=unclassified Streptomyces TaxID=2593676 RepID=UPI000B823B82|nr:MULTISPECIES: hypothetical protein [unclassified Streptomyces]
MNPIRIRVVTASVLAAIGLATAAPLASAEELPRSAAAAPAAEEAGAAESLQALLDSKDPEVQAFMANFNSEELSAFQLAAAAHSKPGDGLVALKAPNWGQIMRALKKIGGFAKAVAGKYDDFKRWVDSRPWYVKYAIKAVSPGLSLYDIWWHFNH